MKEPIIEARHLYKTYKDGENKTYALEDFSLSIFENEFVIVVGGSGFGKTTFLNALGGLDKVDQGEIIVNGDDVTKYNDKKLTLYRRNTVGFVFQFFNLLNDLTIYQNITLAPNARDENKALEILDKVGLLDKKDKYPNQLSGGQQQKASIARALNKPTPILLCDEPTGALDEESGKNILHLLVDLHKEGKTIILVTHSKDIAKIGTRIITIKDGRLLSDESNPHPISVDEVEW
mgnify:CR=1 FL=1